MKAHEERYELVSIFGYPALFTSLRIELASVPESIQRYEIRHEDDNGMAAAQIARGIMVNHMGTLLMRSELPLDEFGYLNIEDQDLVFTNSGIRELDEYMRQYPQPGKLLDATRESYEEVLLGYSEQESVLHHWGMLDSATVPEGLQVLYAYEDNSEEAAGYGLRMFEAGKTIPMMPFVGSYISVRREGSICYREIFTGRTEKLTLQEYMKENGVQEKSAPKKQRQDTER